MIIVPLAVCVIGLMLYIAKFGNEPLREVGKIMFWTGLSVFMFGVIK